MFPAGQMLVFGGGVGVGVMAALRTVSSLTPALSPPALLISSRARAPPSIINRPALKQAGLFHHSPTRDF